MQPDSQIPTRLIRRIHDSPTMAVVSVAGAGTAAISWLLGVAGASRTAPGNTRAIRRPRPHRVRRIRAVAVRIQRDRRSDGAVGVQARPAPAGEHRARRWNSMHRNHRYRPRQAWRPSLPYRGMERGRRYHPNPDIIKGLRERRPAKMRLPANSSCARSPIATGVKFDHRVAP